MTMQARIVNDNIKDIPVRRMDFEFDDSIRTYWFGRDPFLSMLLTGLSCTFPEGERMFMRAVRRYAEGVTDPQLQKEVRAFIGERPDAAHTSSYVKLLKSVPHPIRATVSTVNSSGSSKVTSFLRTFFSK